MFNPTAFENSRPDGVSVLEIFDDPDRPEEAPRRFVPLRRTELHGEITGPLAALRLRQVYRYTRAECDRVLEAVYRFPLPGDAAVTGVRVHFGAVEIRARLKERTRAEDDYREAKKQGRQAALLTRESPDVFTLQVAGIEPDQDVIVETDYVQLARAEGPGWGLRIPLTTSPRYVRADENGSRHAEGQPLLLLRDPSHRFALDLRVQGVGRVQSPTHALDVAEVDGGLRVRLQEGEVVPDRDCLLSWRLPDDQERPFFSVLLHDDEESGQVYFLALLAPPASRRAGPGIPREVILLVDHSGSMEGPKWEAADWAVKQFLSGLSTPDTFALALFHNKPTWFAKALRTADAKAAAEAIRFLEKHRDSGGTELGVALEQALDRPRGHGEAARHVLLITDAEVSDAGRILRLADEEAKQALRRRIDVLCIDAAPNSFLARELAERGGGVARFLTSDPGEDDITTALDEVLADWAQPVVTDLRLDAGGAPLEAAGRALAKEGKDGTAIDLGDLPAGHSLWVAGRVPRERAKELSFRVRTATGREVAGWRVNWAKERGDRPALKAMFGARRVLGLEFLIASGYAGQELADQLARLGYDPGEVLADQPAKKKKVYAENVRADAGRALRRLLVRESLAYGLASSETAFVAVRTEGGKPVQGTVAVANALPAGWSERFVGGPAGAGLLACATGFVATAPAGGATVESMLHEFTDSGPGPSGQIPAPPSLDRSAKPARIFSVFRRVSRKSGLTRASDSSFNDAMVGGRASFKGVPRLENGEAVLFDSARKKDAERLPDNLTFIRLQVELPGGGGDLEAGLSLLLFVDDPATPRARVRLADVMRQGGSRPLNIRRRPGQHVRVVLMDATGAWVSAAPALTVTLCWT
jgi:Ca-activated chloride channel family protein